MPLEIEDYDSQVEPMDEPLATWEDADERLLQAAAAVVARRDAQYGTAYEHHSRTSRMWSAYTGQNITPDQVSAMFILDKIARSIAEDKPDHWLDIAGYAQVHSSVQATEHRVSKLIAHYRMEKK